MSWSLISTAVKLGISYEESGSGEGKAWDEWWSEGYGYGSNYWEQDPEFGYSIIASGGVPLWGLGSKESNINFLTGGWYGAHKSAKKKREAKRQQRRTNTVTSAFETYLGREPNEDELNLYNDAIVNEQINSPEDLRDSLLGTYQDEYSALSEKRKSELMGPAFQKFDYSGFEEPERVGTYAGPAGRLSRTGGDRGTMEFIEAPELRQKRMASIEEWGNLLDEVGITSEERAEQIEQATETYKKRFLADVQPGLEQSLIGRGLRGSRTYADAVAKLFAEAGDLSVMRREELYDAETARKLNLLNLLQGSISQDYQTGFTGAQIGGQAIQFSEGQYNQYQQNLLSRLFSENIAKQQYDLSRSQFAETMLQREKEKKEEEYLEETYNQ